MKQRDLLQSGNSAHLPKTPFCCQVAPGDEANLVRCGIVQFDYNLCVGNRMKKLEMRKINKISKRGLGWPRF